MTALSTRRVLLGGPCGDLVASPRALAGAPTAGPVIETDGSVVSAGTVTEEVPAADGRQLVQDGYAEFVSRRIASAHE